MAHDRGAYLRTSYLGVFRKVTQGERRIYSGACKAYLGTMQEDIPVEAAPISEEMREKMDFLLAEIARLKAVPNQMVAALLYATLEMDNLSPTVTRVGAAR